MKFRRKSKTGADTAVETDTTANKEPQEQTWLQQQQQQWLQQPQQTEQETPAEDQQQSQQRKSRFRPFGSRKQKKSQQKEEENKQQQQQEEQQQEGNDTITEADGRDDTTDDDAQRSTIGSYFANSFDTTTTPETRTTEVAVDDDEKSTGSRRSIRNAWGAMFNRSKDDDDISNIEVVYKDFGEDAVDLLKLVLHDAIPQPRNADDVVVRVEASTVSLTDCIIRRGMWYESISRPISPGFDLVGLVHSVGANVSNFKAGDRVAALVRTGGNARYATVPAASLVTVPLGIDASEAVSVISTYMTAFQALDAARADRDSLEGTKILITGGNGAMGQAFIELAKWAGATEIYASASEKYHARLKYGLGATCLPSDPRFWLPEVQGQMDVVIDSICRDGYESPQKALSKDGRLVCIGVTSILYSEDQPGYFGPPAKAIWVSMKAKMFMRQTTTYEVWESFQNDPDKFKDDLDYLFQMLRNRQIKPNIVKKVRLSEVAEAHKTIESCGVSGQIVCLPWKKFAYRKPDTSGSTNKK